jgi:hypothetical protein
MPGPDPLLRFGAYEPDISDYEGVTSDAVINVVPRADGYGPFQDIQAFTQALPASCRGYFFGRKSDGSVVLFAGTSTKLYRLNNSTFGWTDVSLGAGSYSALSSTANWQFAQFGNLIFATQANVVLQVFDMSSAAAFANNAGSPPQSAYIAVVGQFLVLSGLLSAPYRIQWCGIDDTTNWTAGVNQSDFQDFADGGLTRGIAGGDQYGIVFQDASIRQMTYAPGTSIIFQITRIAQDQGLVAPYSLVSSGFDILFYSSQGFQKLSPGMMPQPIGKEKVDRSFAIDWDSANPQLFIGCNDPNSSRVLFAYKSVNGAAGAFDTILTYDKVLDRWAPISGISGQYLASIAKPGVTLENLDTIATTTIAITSSAASPVSHGGAFWSRLTVATINLPAMPTPADGAPVPTKLAVGMAIDISGVSGATELNGEGAIINLVPDSTHIDVAITWVNNGTGGLIAGPIDAMVPSLDSYPSASEPGVSVFNSASKLGFLDGPNLEASLESSEKGDFGTRIFLSGFRPATDATACLGSVSSRERLQDTRVYSTEYGLTSQGLVPARVSTRYARGKLRIPYGSEWTFAMGIEPETATDGER